MSKVINLHPGKIRFLQEIVSQFRIKKAAKVKDEEQFYTAKGNQVPGVVIQLSPVIKAGWEFYNSELEFE